MESKNSPSSSHKQNERGSIYIIAAMTLVILMTIGAFVIDAGQAYMHQWILRNATDLSALAAIKEKINEASQTDIDTMVDTILANNALDLTGDNTTVVYGSWIDTDGDSKGDTFDDTVSFEDSNAVRVTAQRDVNTMLAVVLGQEFMNPFVSSIAKIGNAGSVECARPFGVPKNWVEGKPFDTDFIISKDGADYGTGKWGIIEVIPGANPGMGNKHDFKDVILGNVCPAPISIGQTLEHKTGSVASVSDGFDEIAGTGTVIPVVVVDDISATGNSVKTCTVEGFALIEIISTSGSGENWEATVQLKEGIYGKGDGGIDDPGPKVPVLVM